MKWKVTITNKARKQADKLPDDIKARFKFLLKRLREYGCYQPQFKRFSKLSENRFHCHIKEGKPNYVIVWELRDKELRIKEVNYAGTHENSPC